MKRYTHLLTKAFRLFLFSTLVAGLALSAGPAPVAHAATFTVDSTTDAVDANPGDGVCATATGECTLRAAIMEANALPGDDTITLPAGTYLLTIAGAGEDAATTGDLDITSNLALNGAGAATTVIDLNGSVLLDRAFHILGSTNVSTSGVTIRGGGTADIIISINGGGIFNSSGSALTLTDSLISNNGAFAGGGLYNAGTLIITRTNFSNNTSNGDGSGIFNVGIATVTNSTIDDNSGGSGITSIGTMVLNDSIISGNSSGIHNSGALTVNASVFSNNTGTGISTNGPMTVTNSSIISNSVGIVNAGSPVIVNNSTVISNTEGGGIQNRTGGNLTLNSSIVSGNSSPTGSGGGIGNDGSTVVVNDSTISNNSASAGGGLANFGQSPFSVGVMILNNITVVSNTAGGGGGIYNGGGTITLTNSAVISNTAFEIAPGNGGWGGGISNGSILTLTNSTVSGNTAADGGGIFNSGTLAVNNSTISYNTARTAGGVDALYANPTLQNTILAGNVATGSNALDCFGTLNSLGHNLIQTTDACTIAGTTTGNLLGVDPLLGPLQDNGGPTLTHALLPGSPAIDAGNPAAPGSGGNACEAADQRGVARPQGARCDIGAFELEVVSQVIQVTIDIKPGKGPNRIEIEPDDDGKKKIQVAILSTAQFDAPQQVDKNSLTFGRTGDEDSLHRKGRKGTPDCRTRDVNHDRRSDLVCTFLTRATGFQLGDTVGILKGQTVEGVPIEGRDAVVIVVDD